MSIPSSFIDQLIDQTDIVEVIGRRLPLNKKGSNFWCLCPFHDDSNPSMAVNQDKQFFYCFVCQESGNAIHFLRRYENLEFVDAIETLASAAGMTVPELQIVNTETIPAYMNFITFFATSSTQNADLSPYREIGGLTGVDFDPELARTSFVPDYSYEESLADDLPELFAHLNLLLASGALSQPAVDSFIDVVAGVPSDTDDDWRTTRVGLAVALVMTSADYLVAH